MHLFSSANWAPLAAAAVLAGAIQGGSGAAAQAAFGGEGPTVTWSVPTVSVAKAKRGDRVVLTLRGQVRDGWHVYGFNQLKNGPIPLVLSVDPSDSARSAGLPTGSKPIVARDETFGFDTPYYTGNFTVSIPVRLGAGPAPGRRAVPVTVRFQTCNGRICQPPKSVHLSVPVDVGASA